MFTSRILETFSLNGLENVHFRICLSFVYKMPEFFSKIFDLLGKLNFLSSSESFNTHFEKFSLSNRLPRETLWTGGIQVSTAKAA